MIYIYGIFNILLQKYNHIIKYITFLVKHKIKILNIIAFSGLLKYNRAK
jgi:hypothetical protein